MNSSELHCISIRSPASHPQMHANKLNRLMCTRKIYGMVVFLSRLFFFCSRHSLLIAKTLSNIRWEFQMIKFNCNSNKCVPCNKISFIYVISFFYHRGKRLETVRICSNQVSWSELNQISGGHCELIWCWCNQTASCFAGMCKLARLKARQMQIFARAIVQSLIVSCTCTS